MRKYRHWIPVAGLTVGVAVWTVRRRGADLLDAAAAITYGVLGTALIGCLIIAARTRGQGV